MLALILIALLIGYLVASSSTRNAKLPEWQQWLAAVTGDVMAMVAAAVFLIVMGAI